MGNDYSGVHYVASPKGAAGHGASIYPGKSIGDVILFEPPVDKAKYLTLKLPAANFGGEGEVEFTFPVAQANQPEPEPEKRSPGESAHRPAKRQSGNVHAPWLFTSYDAQFVNTGENKWEERDGKTGKIKFRFKELARDGDVVELFDEQRKMGVRLSSDKMEVKYEGGDWTGAAAGHWDAPSH